MKVFSSVQSLLHVWELSALFSFHGSFPWGSEFNEVPCNFCGPSTEICLMIKDFASKPWSSSWSSACVNSKNFRTLSRSLIICPGHTHQAYHGNTGMAQGASGVRLTSFWHLLGRGRLSGYAGLAWPTQFHKWSSNEHEDLNFLVCIILWEFRVRWGHLRWRKNGIYLGVFLKLALSWGFY